MDTAPQVNTHGEPGDPLSQWRPGDPPGIIQRERGSCCSPPKLKDLEPLPTTRVRMTVKPPGSAPSSLAPGGSLIPPPCPTLHPLCRWGPCLTQLISQHSCVSNT